VSDSAQASNKLLEAAASDLDAVFASLEELGGMVAEVQTAAVESGVHMRGADLTALRPLLREQLRRHDALVAGIGVLARPGLLGDAPMFVEWWCAGPAEPFLLRVSLDPDHAIFSDYDTFEWFEGPWTPGSKRIVGPWVDYTGTGEHVMTLSVPIFGGEGEFLGVTGADVLARRVEEFALSRLRTIPEDAALVNSDGRVLASNTSRLLVGTLLKDGDRASAIRHEDLPWTVVVFPSN
jgi:hypothetical protein